MPRAPCSMKQPGRRMHVRNTWKGQRERAVLYGNRYQHISRARSDWKIGAIHIPGARYIFLWAGEISISSSELPNFLTILWLLPILSACLRCRAVIGTYLVCCFVQGWLRCAMLCCSCGRCSTTTFSYTWKRPTKTKNREKKAIPVKLMKKRKGKILAGNK